MFIIESWDHLPITARYWCRWTTSIPTPICWNIQTSSDTFVVHEYTMVVRVDGNMTASKLFSNDAFVDIDLGTGEWNEKPFCDQRHWIRRFAVVCTRDVDDNVGLPVWRFRDEINYLSASSYSVRVCVCWAHKCGALTSSEKDAKMPVIYTLCVNVGYYIIKLISFVNHRTQT